MPTVSRSEPTRGSPPVTTDAEVRSLLVSNMAELSDGLLSLIRTQMAKCRISVDSIRISLKESHEEDWQEVVFSVFVDADSTRALEFWDSIGEAINQWRLQLPHQSQRLLDHRIAVFVEWS